MKFCSDHIGIHSYIVKFFPHNLHHLNHYLINIEYIYIYIYIYILGFEPAKVGFEFRTKNLYTHIYTHSNVVY